MFAMIPHRLLAKLGAGSAWRWCRRRVTKKLVRQVLTQLVCFSLVFGDFAFIIPNLAQAEGIVPDGQTATDVTYGPDAIDVTTSTIHGNSALNSFKLFDVYTGEIVNLHIPVGATNLLNLVHEKKSQIDGIVNAYKNGSIGGNVYFLNPYGMIVGEKGRLNVGQLTVITPPPTFMEQFFTDLDNSVNRVLSGDAEIDDAGEIRIEGEINATQGLTLLAGQVTNTGRLVVDVTQSPDFADLVNLDGLESGNEIRISNGNIEIVATGDVTNSGEILTTVKGNTDLDAGDITIDAGGRIVIEKAGVIDARGGMENSSGGDVRLSAEERVEHAGQIYTGSEQKDAQGPAADPSGTVSLLAPEIYISGLINAGTHEDGISSGDVYITARRDSGGTARIRLDGAEVFGRDIFIAAGSSLVDNEATGLVRPEVTASIEMYSKAHPDRFTLIQAGRDVGLLAEARVELEVGAAVESGDTYDAGYAAVDVDSTSRIQLLEMAGIIAGGDVEIEARNTVNISTTVNPAAQGAEGDYIGGSVAVNRVTTRTEALINSGMPLEVSSLSVKATSANTVTAVATAPASGAQEDPGQESRMARTLDEYREDAQTSEGAISVAAALAINDITSTTRAEIGGDAGVVAQGRVDVISNATYNSAVNADAASVVPGEGTLGAALGINKVNSQNYALLDTEVSAGEGISVAARMTDDELDKQAVARLSTIDTSGGGAGGTSVSGALAVNVQRTDSGAFISRDIETIGGNIDVISVNLSENTAEAKPGQTGGRPGIGPSVAVNVAINSTRAGSPDDALLSRLVAPDSDGSGVKIRAVSEHDVSTTAEAGAGGDIGFAPAVALAWVENTTHAGLGAAAEELWSPILGVSGDIHIAADAKERVTTRAVGQNAEEGRAFGTAIALTVGESSTEAYTARGIDTDRKVIIEAKNSGTINTEAIAGIGGGQKADDETPENGVDQKIADQKALIQDKREAVTGEGKNKEAPAAETGEGQARVAGAIGVSLVTATTRARIADDTQMWAGAGLTLRSAANIDTAVVANGSTVSGGGSGAGVGAAVAINQAILTNEAYLGSGFHYAGNFTIEAITLETGSGEKTDKESSHSAEATSGAGSAEVGVAGSLAINLTESRTIARTGDQAHLSNGAVNISASEQAKNIARAVPAKSQVGGKEAEVGVGASVAVNVVLGETVAEIGDEAMIEANREGAGISVTANGDYSVTTEAHGGAAGDVAVTPAVAVTVAERVTLARLGVSGGNGAQPNIAVTDGDLTVRARSKENITTTAKGSSQGGSAAIGAAVAVALVDGTTEAVLAYQVESQGKVTVEAASAGVVESSATAGAKGEKEKDASTPEDGVDKKVKEQTTLAEKKRDEAKGGERGADQGQGDQGGGGASGEPTDPKPAPSAETGEGKVGVAGAIGVNVVTSTTRARTADDISVNATGNFTLLAAANNDTKVSADGSTVSGGGNGAGVGAAVAINQATLTNEAYLGSGSFHADSITIEAKTLETGSGDKADKENVHSAEATSGAGSAKISVAGSLAINLTESRTIARTGSGTLLSSGSIKISAAEQAKNIAKALPAKSQVGGKETEVGVGASVAVNVVLGETTAELGDEGAIDATREGAGVGVVATGDYTITTEAQGGATGDVAVTPAVAVTVAERATLAKLGFSGGSDGQPNYAIVDGDISVEAISKESITTTAKGSSQGETAAIGAAVAVALVDNTTEAILAYHVVSQGLVNIEAKSIGKVETGAVAGAKGEKEKDASTPEDGVDKKVKEQTTLAEKKRDEAKGGERGADQGQGDQDGGRASGEPTEPKPVPSAETGEGKVGVAGAIGVNVVTSNTRARTADGVNISAAGDLTLQAAANTDTKVAADGSTVGSGGSGAGVGAAVAINQATLTNEAYLGSGKLYRQEFHH
ncbi:MAG TPA: leukotoxin LktA family filamentous adhesin [Firmicutes bacterium]|nr:leukotoxin LktA family filamentous adhesin [Bacillota bacterium]